MSKSIKYLRFILALFFIAIMITPFLVGMLFVLIMTGFDAGSQQMHNILETFTSK